MAGAHDLYQEEMGRDPPNPGDHPLAHQWDYRGSKEERDRLRAELTNGMLDERGEQPTQDEQLF